MMPEDKWNNYQILKGLAPEYIQALADRFWAKVQKSDGCWEWTACCNGKGYGAIGVLGSSQSAHRVSYELHIGPIPEHSLILHHCDNPPCIRPDHLYAGSHVDNVQDTIDRERFVKSTAKLDKEDVVFWRNHFDPAKHTTAKVAQQLGVAQRTVTDFLTGETYPEWPGRIHETTTTFWIPNEDKNRARALYASGMAPQDILPLVDISKSSLYRIINGEQ